jgi:hypothetical protein
MFTYVALPDPSKQFRLLSLQPSSRDTLIDCQLEVHDIADSPPYYAISYHYGDPSAVDTILVNDQEAHINRNAWHALDQLTLHQPERCEREILASPSDSSDLQLCT